MNFTDSPVYIIGSGNIAWHLANMYTSAPLHVKGIWSRNQEAGMEISDKFHIPFIEEDTILGMEGIFILAISDSAIESVAARINKNSVVIHTSGSTSIEILSKTHTQAGVFYPLQTFSKYKAVHFSEIPILIEYSNNDVKTLLEFWSEKLNSQSNYCNSADRMKYHIAAVFACNFVNHLIAQSEEWIKLNNLNFNILKPLITETTRKAIAQGTLQSQTGPAIRNDLITIEKHLKALESHPDLKKMYSFVTESIFNFHTKKKEDEL